MRIRCPKCHKVTKTRVIHSLLVQLGRARYRRHVCKTCGETFSTKEKLLSRQKRNIGPQTP